MGNNFAIAASTPGRLQLDQTIGQLPLGLAPPMRKLCVGAVGLIVRAHMRAVHPLSCHTHHTLAPAGPFCRLRARALAGWTST